VFCLVAFSFGAHLPSLSLFRPSIATDCFSPNPPTQPQPTHPTPTQTQPPGRAFMAQLLARPEREIAVVTHSSFVHYLLTNYGHSASTAVQGDLHRWFENAELRSVVVADRGSLARPADPTHFAGERGRRLGS